MPETTLGADGAVHLAALVANDLERWLDLTHRYFAQGKAGVRIAGDRELRDAAALIVKRTSLDEALGKGSWRCVRAIAFDKTPAMNWGLGWHQDRTIAVTTRVELPNFGPWSKKDGIDHVEPPFSLLERMRTLRIHFGTVDKTSGALLVARGSHRLGKVDDCDVRAAAEARSTLVCEAQPGDGWLYATPVLHASARSSGARRRVLQLDLSRDDLPAPLSWRGIG